MSYGGLETNVYAFRNGEITPGQVSHHDVGAGDLRVLQNPGISDDDADP